MKITDHYTLPAIPEVVWVALNDPDVLKECLPGCRALERIDEYHFQSTIQVRVGPASATFRSEVELSDLEPPNRYTIVGQGNAGGAGFAKVVARVGLVAVETGTVLTYDADVEIGGKLMSVGARLIQSASIKNIEAFFGAFQSHVERIAAAGDTSAGNTPVTAVSGSELTEDFADTGAPRPETINGAPRVASLPRAGSEQRTQPLRSVRESASQSASSGTVRWPVWIIAALSGATGVVVGLLAAHVV
ncbi:polyketide cyclase / dehydrase and lipid transport family protein [Paraburkholderia xenovorans LB400]|uniref:Carbon monoxide dehydrogenase subunit G n=1 Tax=Paraburkholderia xenovorans (strain LB400) TaxID=266265 RepID=Q13J83_PARXL|nr:carbon monoxide dehydrogenase subunit G [Paraburkholderia xenovorans]ABE35856.1 Putative Carbon monoxide dehydrogenase subunit G [Paraburkholderia xenovorans LB400]AIP38002.1 polyketide cyclase / dehydrase and lipid transport family protein [Paraburkholderia xenovorans LB400]